jgi:hypothetical protein
VRPVCLWISRAPGILQLTPQTVQLERHQSTLTVAHPPGGEKSAAFPVCDVLALLRQPPARYAKRFSSFLATLSESLPEYLQLFLPFTVKSKLHSKGFIFHANRALVIF